MAEAHTQSLQADEDVCQRFDAAWAAGRPEPIEAFLPPEAQPEYRATLEELVHIELEWAWTSWGQASTQTGAASSSPPGGRLPGPVSPSPRRADPPAAAAPGVPGPAALWRPAGSPGIRQAVSRAVP